MIIDYFNVVRVPFRPHETNSELIVDANAVLALSVAAKRLQTVARGCSQIRKLKRTMEEEKLLQRRAAKIYRETPTFSGIPQELRIGVGEASDHPHIITPRVKNGKR